MSLLLLGVVALFFWCAGRLSNMYAKPQAVDRLKNALLALALSMACKKDMSNDMMYGSYDGSKLPLMAGASLANACFTYILDIAEFRKDPLYTQVMEAKILAVHKYIDKNLDTEDKVIDLFERYVSEIKTSAT